MSDVQNMSIISLDFEESTLTLDLSDGRTIQLPLEWYPRLLHAPENERNNWRLIGNGEGIHWETLDDADFEMVSESRKFSSYHPEGEQPERTLRPKPRRHADAVGEDRPA
jgi:hypothetical protein